ncbi:unnamed protein product [Brachionus calyciflorus]|uniref:Uncharacterized protein n=1 Tax=Brachionus calyciflorus TaxID=104777 RepID=A0A813TF56_9BILA|nr:unnamed protein product [Brachionus calyciflorus]
MSSQNSMRKRLQPYSHDHRVVNDFDDLIDFALPLVNENFNLSHEDLFYLRCFLLIYFILQFICCLLLFVLNNWHYIALWYDTFKRRGIYPKKFKNTLSVMNFSNKTNKSN